MINKHNFGCLSPSLIMNNKYIFLFIYNSTLCHINYHAPAIYFINSDVLISHLRLLTHFNFFLNEEVESWWREWEGCLWKQLDPTEPPSNLQLFSYLIVWGELRYDFCHKYWKIWKWWGHIRSFLPHPLRAYNYFLIWEA